jgi:putative membrane protein
MLSTLAATAAAAHVVGPWVGGFGWVFIFIPLFWIALIVFVVTMVARRRRAWGAQGFGPGHWGPYGYGAGGWNRAGRSAEQTLAERFANGDIDEVEYRARLEVIRANERPMGQ